MRLIYTDEAGTSEREPVSVVASIVVDGDRQWRDLALAFNEALDRHVPAKIRQGFVFHGLEVFNGGKTIKRDEWPYEERLDLFKEVLAIPLLVHDVPIAVGSVFRGQFDAIMDGKKLLLKGYEVDHLQAFSMCMDKADKFLRKYLNGDEIGTVIAEDTPRMRRFIAATALSYRDSPMTLYPEHLRGSSTPETFEIKNIVDTVNFVEKNKAILLQIADACAFAFRRALSRQDRGDELVYAMLGERSADAFLADDRWFSGSSSGLFSSAKSTVTK